MVIRSSEIANFFDSRTIQHVFNHLILGFVWYCAINNRRD